MERRLPLFLPKLQFELKKQQFRQKLLCKELAKCKISVRKRGPPVREGAQRAFLL